MDYLSEIEAFNTFIVKNHIDAKAQALWYALMYVNNKCNWSEWFTVSVKQIQLLSGMGEARLSVTSDALKRLGLIDFSINDDKTISYKMISLL